MARLLRGYPRPPKFLRHFLLDESNRTATIAVTGGGVVSLASTTERFAAVSLTGGGSVALSSTTGRFAPLTLSGGGTVVLAATTVRFGSLSVTGGGRVLVSSENHRQAVLGLTGGGTVTLVARTTRFGSLSLTGGGSISLEGAAGGVTSPAVDRRPGVVYDLRRQLEEPIPAVYGTLATTQPPGAGKIRAKVLPPDEAWLLGIDDETPEGSLLATVFG